MSSKKLHRWYKHVLSGYAQAIQSGQLHQHDLQVSNRGKPQRIAVPIYKPEHIGAHMAIDEKSIDGECYTILSNRTTNKIAMMANTLKVKYLAKILTDTQSNMSVKSVSRDMAPNYNWLCREVFINAYHVVDKFHVIKQVLDSLQSIRIRYRQEELAKRRHAYDQNQKYIEIVHENGDTTLQLLARSRGLLFKVKSDWTEHQQQRAAVLFECYPQIAQAYKLILAFRAWYRPPKGKTTYHSTRQSKSQKLKAWINKIEASQIYELKNIASMINKHLTTILNYFISKVTNAKAEALNRNINRFINVNYGARNKDFFLY